MSVPVRDKPSDTLENFAKRIEKRLLLGKDGPFAMERLVCRFLTNKKHPAVAAMMVQKWVEWRYGKATEHVKIEGHLEHTHIDTSKLSDEQLAQIENLVESAVTGSDS